MPINYKTADYRPKTLQKISFSAPHNTFPFISNYLFLAFFYLQKENLYLFLSCLKRPPQKAARRRNRHTKIGNQNPASCSP